MKHKERKKPAERNDIFCANDDSSTDDEDFIVPGASAEEMAWVRNMSRKINNASKIRTGNKTDRK